MHQPFENILKFKLGLSAAVGNYVDIDWTHLPNIWEPSNVLVFMLQVDLIKFRSGQVIMEELHFVIHEVF